LRPDFANSVSHFAGVFVPFARFLVAKTKVSRLLQEAGKLLTVNFSASMQEFIPNTETYSLPPGSPAAPQPSREPVRVILIGSAGGINLVIGILHRLGFAEPRAWSKAQLDPATGMPMRILTKWIRRGGEE
jgi:hypothetical protein